MSRYINFRIWHKLTRTYMEPSAFIFYDDRGVAALDAWADYRIYRCNIEEVEIEQSTGLKDKNGKEIYEGDILEDERKFRSVIKWDSSQAKFIYEKDPSMVFYQGHVGANMKIVGNIHENPELLDGEK